MRKLLLLYIVLVFLNACVYKPTAYEMAQADYGQVPDSYEGMIKHKLKQDLPDPHAATRRDLTSQQPFITVFKF